jgi:hypothetical protein
MGDSPPTVFGVRIRLPIVGIADGGVPNPLGGTSSSLAPSGNAISSGSGGSKEISESDDDGSRKRTIGRRNGSESLDDSSDRRTWKRGTVGGFRADPERFGSRTGPGDGRKDGDPFHWEMSAGRGSSESEEDDDMPNTEREGGRRVSVASFERMVSWNRRTRSRKALISSMSVLFAIRVINGRCSRIVCKLIHRSDSIGSIPERVLLPNFFCAEPVWFLPR